jgi:hypothetical protein
MNIAPPPSAGTTDAPAIKMPDVANITSGLNDIKTNLNNAVSDFASKTTVDAGNEFLESNTIVAKFAFIIVIVLIFMLLFNAGSMIISYFMQPPSSPYIIDGMINGNESKTIKQDPRTNAPLVQYSANRDGGAEFTYSTWLYLTGESDEEDKHVFTKGHYTQGKTNGAPSLYVYHSNTPTDKSMHAKINMDTMKDDGTVDGTDVSNAEEIDISDLPLRKWIHLAIRLQNRVLDVYVNGVLTQRRDLMYIPRQNFSDVYICQDGGFAGNLSDLRYFDSALNVFQISKITASGPNTTTSKSSDNAQASSKFNSYLSSNFYFANRR